MQGLGRYKVDGEAETHLYHVWEHFDLLNIRRIEFAFTGR